MAEHPRIEELRRRVEKDPASLAFAHLAEEYRRAGRHAEAIATCRAGLKFHPTYLLARVTLGRALIDTGNLDAARAELHAVMTAAPDNLAAIRGLADIHRRRGELNEALEYYRWAQEFARHDPDLDQHVRELEARVECDARAGASPRQAVEPAGEAPAAQVDAAAASPVPEVGRTRESLKAERRLAFFKRFLEAILADRTRRRLEA